MAEYVGVLIMLALVSVPACLALAWLGRRAVRRSRSDRAALPPEPVDESSGPGEPAMPEPAMGVDFFLSAVAFLAFQAAGLLLVPFALSFGGLGFEGLIQGALFVLPLAVGFAYLWRKGALGR